MEINDPVEAELRRMFRERLPIEQWLPRYDAAVADALHRSDLAATTNLLSVLAVTLDRDGRVHEVVDRVRYIERLAGEDHDARTLLASLRSAYAVGNLDFPEARAALADADRWRAAATSDRAIAEYESSAMVARAVMLEPDAHEPLLSAAAHLSGSPYDGLLLLVKSWAIPYLAARGDRLTALAVLDSLRAVAHQHNHNWRKLDAAYSDTALTMPIASLWSPAGLDAFDDTMNRFVTWRAAVSSLYAADIAGDNERLSASIARIGLLADRAERGLCEGWETVVGFISNAPGIRHAAPPVEVALSNLPIVLAGMHGVALNGPQYLAAQWLRWVDEHVPAWCRTDIVWPASIDRLKGLLAAKAGDLRRGSALLQAGAKWAQSVGYRAEHALATLQFAEVSEVIATPRGRHRQLREEARQQLGDLGIPWERHARVAAAGARLQADALSPREAEVLGLVAEGLRNREIATRLAISERTVQTFLRRTYEKLGVTNRTSAIRAARDTGVLQ